MVSVCRVSVLLTFAVRFNFLLVSELSVGLWAILGHALFLLYGGVCIASELLEGEQLWGDPACFGDIGATEVDATPALRTNYVWCCLSFARDHLGHPECWLNDTLSFGRCCIIPHVDEAAQGKTGVAPIPVASRSLGYLQLEEARVLGVEDTVVFDPHRKELTRQRHLNLKHPRLAKFSSLQGCDEAAWDEVLFAAKIKGGCLPCSTPPAELQSYLQLAKWQSSPGAATKDCPAGRMLLAVSLFLATPEQHLGEPTRGERESMRDEALTLLADVERELQMLLSNEQESQASRTHVSGRLFFDVFGLTPAQARYTLLHASLAEDYQPIFDYGLEGRVNSTRLVFDVGMSGGMDSFFYLVHGFRVVAVEANPLLVLDARSALQRYGSKFNVVNAAIVDEEEMKRGDRPEASVAVDFFIHRERPDFSALDGERVPIRDRAGTMSIRKLTCRELVLKYGRPYGLKIDAEGADRACLTSLRDANVFPLYVSTELPNIAKNGQEAAVALLVLLGSMNYTGFKLCRQTIYNARTVVAVDQETNLSNIFVSRQGLGLGTSGLFGEAAVDWISGPRWRSLLEIVPELAHGGPLWAAATMGEWFDLHARRR